MFTAVLFTIAKIWKQPKCPSTDEWIKKMWYIHIMECYSGIKKNEIMLFAATWMDLKIITLSEVKDKYHMISLICGIQRNDTNELTKQKQTHRFRKQTCLTKGKGGAGGINQKFGVNRYT